MHVAQNKPALHGICSLCPINVFNGSCGNNNTDEQKAVAAAPQNPYQENFSYAYVWLQLAGTQ